MSSLVHTRLRVAVSRAAVLAVLGLFAAPGAAFASCPPPPVSTPFSQWGDTNSYFPLPGGSFEGTADQVGWSLSGASLTPGNERFFVNDSGDGQSLSIAGGGSATSPFFCVDNTMGSMRFFAQQQASGGDLRVQALVRTSRGVKTVPVGGCRRRLNVLRRLNVRPGRRRSRSPATAPVCQTVGRSWWRCSSRCPTRKASWQIDDIYVDPYRSG